MTYTIAVEPSRSPGKVTARSSDGNTLSTSMPLLDGARYWQQLGAPSTASIVTIWSSGAGHWSLRSTIGHAARLTVEDNRLGKPTFRRFRDRQESGGTAPPMRDFRTASVRAPSGNNRL